MRFGKLLATAAVVFGLVASAAPAALAQVSFGGSYTSLTPSPTPTSTTIREFTDSSATTYQQIYVGAGIDPATYRSYFTGVLPTVVDANSGRSVISQNNGYRYFTAAFATPGLYSLRIASNGDAIGAIYARSGGTGLPFSSSALLTNLVAFSDDHGGVTANDPWPVYYNQTTIACTTVQFLIYEYNGNGNSLTGTFSVQGPGRIAPNCAALGPNAPNTVRALQANAVAVKAMLVTRVQEMVTAFDYDCSIFSQLNVCMSFGTRYSSTGQGIEQLAGVLVAAYRPMPGLRIGGYLDIPAEIGATAGLSRHRTAPLFGAFAVWDQQPDNLGLRLRGSIGYQAGGMTITRSAALENTEPGSGRGSLDTIGIAAEAAYGWPLSARMQLAPYLGIRHVSAQRGTYGETGSAAVAYPIAYRAFEQDLTSATAGARVFARLGERLSAMASAGLEQDLARRQGAYRGASQIAGLESFSLATQNKSNATRATASVAAYYALSYDERLSLHTQVRQQAYSSAAGVTVVARYTVAF